jgi:hypothetical protein
VLSGPYRGVAGDLAEPLHAHINQTRAFGAGNQTGRTSRRPVAMGSATLASMSFDHDDLARIHAAHEVDIETQAPDGPIHRVTIWAVVDDGEVLVRSYLGPTARWYVEALANPAVALHVDGRRLTATAIPATDPDTIERASAGFVAKYPPSASATAMATQFLDTTLRLVPA